MKLNGNTILITGGASGIGLALTRLLHRNGNKIIVCGRDEGRLAGLKKQLPDVVTYPCDLADEPSLDRFADAVLANHPDLNMLINNAGVQHNFQFTEGRSHGPLIREELDTNLFAPIRLTDRLLPLLLRRNSAAIVNITSALAFAPKKARQSTVQPSPPCAASRRHYATSWMAHRLPFSRLFPRWSIPA